LVFLRLELVLLGSLSQFLDGGRNRLETTGLSTLDNGGDQSSGGGNSNRNVNVLELLNVVSGSKLDVGLGNIAQSQRSGLDQEVVDRDLDLELV
jgi:hypothetical protein